MPRPLRVDEGGQFCDDLCCPFILACGEGLTQVMLKNVEICIRRLCCGHGWQNGDADEQEQAKVVDSAASVPHPAQVFLIAVICFRRSTVDLGRSASRR